jgi:hypothetical protein
VCPNHRGEKVWLGLDPERLAISRAISAEGERRYAEWKARMTSMSDEERKRLRKQAEKDHKARRAAARVPS